MPYIFDLYQFVLQMKILLLGLLSILMISNISAQHEIKKVKFGYQFKGDLYECRKLGEVLQSDSEAIEQYKLFLNSKKAADIYGVASLIGIAVSLSVPLKKCRTGGDSPDYECWVPNFFLFLGSCLSGILGIHQNSKAKGHFKKSLDIWNNNIIIDSSADEYQIKFDSTNNGFGLVLNF